MAPQPLCYTYGLTGGKQWALLEQPPQDTALDVEKMSDDCDVAARDGRGESGTTNGTAKRLVVFASIVTTE